MARMAVARGNDTLRRALLRLRQEVSEGYFAAGWRVGFGPALWACIHDDVFDVRIGLSTEELTDLRALSALAGGWWDWVDDEPEGLTFFVLDDWNARYRAIREGAA